MNSKDATLGVWLINLPRSTERLARMQKQLAEIGLDHTLFSAVDGRAEWDTIKHTVNVAAFCRNVGRDILPGEIGAYHSHLAVWNAMLSTPCQVALILEDDVVFHDDFMKAIGLAVENMDEWDFLKLNKIRAKWPLQQKKIDGYSLNAYIGPATGLGAYMIHRNLVERLLPNMTPIERPIDHELDLLHKHRFRHFGMEPFPSHVDDGSVSTITGRNFKEVTKWPFFYRLPTYWLRLRNRTARFAYMLSSGLLSRR